MGRKGYRWEQFRLCEQQQKKAQESLENISTAHTLVNGVST